MKLNIAILMPYINTDSKLEQMSVSLRQIADISQCGISFSGWISVESHPLKRNPNLPSGSLNILIQLKTFGLCHVISSVLE